MKTPTEAVLRKIFDDVRKLRSGDVASYIPELAVVDPERFGIALVTTDGYLYEVGDTGVPFTIQSISKPFVYALALEAHGLDAVHAKVGCEPSGEAFNRLSVEKGTGRPFNPMINAGAIACSALVPGSDAKERLDNVLEMFGRYTGRAMSIDEATFRSERATGDRNREIAASLFESGIIEGRLEESLDLYFQQCSVSVTCVDLAFAAATLAASGRNPRTGTQALREDLVEKVLSVMGSCGMYDFSGGWIFRIGMPAKSGVGGGVIAVLPGQLGIGVFSPRLDEKGNSVRGIAVCEEISRELHLHLFRTPSVPQSVIRSRYTVAEVRSKRRRTTVQETRLRDIGGAGHVYELQGRLMFSTGEVLFREIAHNASDCRALVLDVRRVTAIEEGAADLLALLAHDFFARGREVAFAHLPPGSTRHARIEYSWRAAGLARRLRAFSGTDEALEWCEEVLLDDAGAPPPDVVVAVEDHELLLGLDREELTLLRPLLERVSCSAGTSILRRGEASGGLFLVESGIVDVRIELEDGGSHRLATLGPGRTFGEMSLLDDGPRSADVTAQTEVIYHALGPDGYRRLEREAPRIVFKLVRNLARDLAGRLRQANAEIGALGR
jgi:glutaminase